MSLVLKRKPGHTWLEAAREAGIPWGLEAEIEAEYHQLIANGATESEAAWCAAYDSDVLDFRDDDEPPTSPCAS